MEILAPGPLATVQDFGRPGWSRLGLSSSGAADFRSLALANRLVGNTEDAAGIEATWGGLRIRAHCRRVDGRTSIVYVSLTGAPCPIDVNGRPAAWCGPIALRDGDVLTLGAPTSGLRTYLAVRGGLAVPPVLGSRSTDLLSGTGPAPLAAGDRLAVGQPVAPMPGVDLAPCTAPPEQFLLRVWPGPRSDWFTQASLRELLTASWQATSRSNRVGLRLSGPPLTRCREEELPAEGMVSGALQVPPSGQPVLFLTDHPVTGGYPVVAVVHGDDLPLAGQIPPGASIRFRLHQATAWES
ncbi:biotin-dependent carboxyltransferase family protein [Streptomyces sp. NPDC046805]|uniref:5-oxoprolinase subunit C family protein n=1 Tax=Streptomyces sp. NPDC046805 TaxID=3155134 RepID=UPI0033DED421